MKPGFKELCRVNRPVSENPWCVLIEAWLLWWSDARGGGSLGAVYGCLFAAALQLLAWECARVTVLAERRLFELW
jgi:hypothetical protein